MTFPIVTITGNVRWYQHKLIPKLAEDKIPPEVAQHTPQIGLDDEPKLRLRILTIPTEGTSQGGRYTQEIILGLIDLMREIKSGHMVTVALALDISNQIPTELAAQIRTTFQKASQLFPEAIFLLTLEDALTWVVARVKEELDL